MLNPARGRDEFWTTKVSEFVEPALTVMGPEKLIEVFVGVPL